MIRNGNLSLKLRRYLADAGWWRITPGVAVQKLMIKRIVEISSARTHLSIQYGQLVIRENASELSRIPCEDIGVLLVDHQATTYTHCVFTQLLEKGAAVVLCGGDHHPAGMLLPIESNSIQAERFREQIEAAEPVKKRLWKQIVRAKIRHQAKILGKGSEAYNWLMALRRRVRSGDPENIEAQASKRYWAAYLQDVDLVGQQFRRDIDGAPPNNLLNYGYMVMRAAVARALCSAGLLPSLGIHHRNRYNAFCLADDMVEPFRGFVESKVREICRGEGAPDELDQRIKARLLEILYDEVEIAGYKGPLMVGLHRTMASLQRCFAGEQKDVDLPEL
ncbi:MAG: type II CRISPR-associated endonuclease Cas1 [Sedimentisphaerales bacterium]|nr:type II CRISPR-associated endonuclease Cas1 [Sedimentisphaerales bacterium]